MICARRARPSCMTLDGQIGEVTSLRANDYRGGIWVKPRQPDWTDMVYQMRNWYYFTWLSGDFNVEQHVHFLDVCLWAMKDVPPEKAIGMGGASFAMARNTATSTTITASSITSPAPTCTATRGKFRTARAS